MSYCRFSTDDFSCDAYVYGDASGGWTAHVASSRYVLDAPLPALPAPPGAGVDTRPWAEEFLVATQARAYVLERAATAPIGLASDGQRLHTDTPGGMADHLERLRAEGYRVPQGAIDALRAE